MSAANGNSLHSLVVLSDSVSLYCGDCRDILPTLGKVDAVVTDPPYGHGYKSNGCCLVEKDGTKGTI